MKESEFLIEMDDGLKLFVRRWQPDGPVRACLQIVHGMAEHSGRYRRLASLLTESGIEVWADDHRGHGHTADTQLNGKANGGLLGHCADKNGFFKVVSDLEALSSRIKRELPDVPLFLLGHSWGSFLAQAYIERSASGLAGCVLSGTRGPGGLDVTMGALFARFLAFFGSPRRHSPLIMALADGSYNKAFAPNRTAFDWLSRDEAEVDVYVADPLCGFKCSLGFYRDLLTALKAVHRPSALACIPRDLPIFIFAGTDDPVGSFGASPSLLSEVYQKAGISDMEFVLYPQARHETLNEQNRAEVQATLLGWLKRHIQQANK